MNLIETERLTLSELRLSDAEFILQLLNEPAFHKYIGDKGVRTAEDASDYLKDGPLASYQNNGFGLYLAKLKNENISIGICGLKKRGSMDIPDLGYAFLKQYWSCGYATEAARGVLDYARDDLKFRELAALTAIGNDASVRVLEKLGFRFQEIVKLPEFESESKLFLIDL